MLLGGEGRRAGEVVRNGSGESWGSVRVGGQACGPCPLPPSLGSPYLIAALVLRPQLPRRRRQRRPNW